MNHSLRRLGTVWMLVLSLAACAPAGRLPVPTVTSPTPGQIFMPLAHGASPLPTATTSPVLLESTIDAPTDIPPPPTPSPAIPICTSSQEIDSAFVTDVALPDDTRLPPQTTFRKTWRVRNTGSCTWPAGMELKHIAGVALPGSQVLPLADTLPGAEVDISLIFLTPERLGKHESFWRLQAPDGHLVGAVLFVTFVIDADAEYQQEPVVEPPSPVDEEAALTVTGVSPSPPLAFTATAVPPTPTRVPTLTPSPEPSAVPLTATPPLDDGEVCRLPDRRFTPVIELAKTLEHDRFCANDSVKEERGLLQLYWPGALISSANADIADGEMPATPTTSPSWVILAPDAGQVTILGSRDPASPVTSSALYESSWLPTMSERSPTCAILVPPTGAIFPTKAIGAVWCEESLWLTIGWPMAPPASAHLATQDLDNGLLMEMRVGDARYLVAVDTDQHHAVVYELP